MNQLDMYEQQLYGVQVSNTPRLSGNSVADTQIQLLKLMDKSPISSYMDYEDWRDDTWEVLPSCDTRNSDPLFFDTTWKNHQVSGYNDSQADDGKGFFKSFLIFVIVMLLIVVISGKLMLKKNQLN